MNATNTESAFSVQTRDWFRLFDTADLDPRETFAGDAESTFSAPLTRGQSHRAPRAPFRRLRDAAWRRQKKSKFFREDK